MMKIKHILMVYRECTAFFQNYLNVNSINLRKNAKEKPPQQIFIQKLCFNKMTNSNFQVFFPYKTFPLTSVEYQSDSR